MRPFKLIKGIKMHSTELYILLFAKKVNTPDQFLDQIIDPHHQFYSAARDIAKEIMKKEDSWKWLEGRLDDVAGEAEKTVAKKVQKWKFKSLLGTGKMPMNSTENTIKWLFQRMTNEYKNLFNPKRKNFLNIKKIDKIIQAEAWNKIYEEANDEY
jgi:hypothetical protein